MKKLALFLVTLLTLTFSAKADHDQIVAFDQLPQAAQALLKQHFASKVPLVITVDRDDYTIVYESGEKVEFDKQGNWKEINCRTSQVPAELIPEQIKAHVHTAFAGATIVSLDRDRRGYEIKLSNGLDVEYNRAFQVVEIDD